MELHFSKDIECFNTAINLAKAKAIVTYSIKNWLFADSEYINKAREFDEKISDSIDYIANCNKKFQQKVETEIKKLKLIVHGDKKDRIKTYNILNYEGIRAVINYSKVK